MVDFVPVTNLAANKAIVIDTIALAPGVLHPSQYETIQSTTSNAQGTCEIGATVSIASIYLETNPTTTDCDDGTFSVPITFLNSGLNVDIVLSITQTDAVGNESDPTENLVHYAPQTGGGGGGYSPPLSDEAPTANVLITSSQPNSAPEDMGTTSTTNNMADDKEISKEESVAEKTVVTSAIFQPVAVEPYMASFIKLGGKNNPEDVKKLQIFLNVFE